MPFCGPKIRVEVLLTASQQFHLDSRYYSLYIMPHNNKMQRSKYLLIRKLRIRLTWKKTEKKNRISNYSFSPTCISANILQVSLRGTTDSHYLKKPSQDYRSPRHYDRRTVGQPLSPFWCQAHNQIFVLVSWQRQKVCPFLKGWRFGRNFLSNALRYPKEHCFEASKDSTSCPFDRRSTKIKMSKVNWWNETEREIELLREEKNLSHCHSVRHECHSVWLGSNGGPCS